MPGVILVNAMRGISTEALQEALEMAASLYGGWLSDNLIGCILNKVQTTGGTPSEGAVEVQGAYEGRSPQSVTKMDRGSMMLLREWRSRRQSRRAVK